MNELIHSKKALLGIAGIVVIAAVLVACGGGGTAQSTTEVTATASTTSQAAATSTAAGALATVPPGWVPRGYQVINGITVPPEPDPAVNNATLAGVDLNKNGVRDDVERAIARAALSPATFLSALPYARGYQALLTKGVPPDRITALVRLGDALCPLNALSQDIRAIRMGVLVVNTPARKTAYDAFNKVLVAYSPEDLPCAQ